MVPDGSTLDGYSVFMAERFQTMPVNARKPWKPHRRAWLMWIRAKDLGMQVSDMQPWLHYDPVQIDEDVERWVHGPGVRFAGTDMRDDIESAVRLLNARNDPSRAAPRPVPGSWL